jgi:hypothetical protein
MNTKTIKKVFAEMRAWLHGREAPAAIIPKLHMELTSRQTRVNENMLHI